MCAGVTEHTAPSPKTGRTGAGRVSRSPKRGWKIYRIAVPLEAAGEVDSVFRALEAHSSGSRRTRRTAAFLWLIAQSKVEVLNAVNGRYDPR